VNQGLQDLSDSLNAALTGGGGVAAEVRALRSRAHH